MKSFLDLSTEEQERLSQLFKAEGIESPEKLTIPPLKIKDHLPLSYAQQRLWFLYEFEADKALYNIPVRLRVKGKLEVKALEQALNKIMQRHEVLRSRVAEVEGRAIQVIEEAVELKLRVEELAGEQEAGAGESVQRWIEEEISRSFDLRQGPMLRARVLKVKEAEHVLLVTLHHIAADGWSLGVLAREMKELYAGYVQGKESLLPELPIQYADYAVWQREWLKGGVEKEQLGYWREQLRGMSGVLELPGAGGRAAMGHEGGIHRFSLSAQLVKGMKELGRKAGVTQFMTLLAGLQVVLSRYSGERDIAVGTPLAGRTREETEGLIGFFVNTVVLRTEVGGEQSFEELLKGVRETALGAYVHQDIPFEKLVEELQVEREGGRSPLFQVMCVMLNDEMKARWELRGLEVEEEVVELGREKFDLTVQFVERGGKIEGEISYRRALYERGMVERLARHLGVLLERVVEDEGKRIREQELLTEGEREQILVKWNQTGVEYGRERCIHELFEEQVKKTPEAPALIFGNQELTYRDLNHRANQLAHYLRKIGIRPDMPVAICVERSLEMIVSILATLKAGGAYLPLDPGYPSDRLNYMFEDSAATVMLTQGHLAGLFTNLKQSPLLVDVNEDGPQRTNPRTNLAISETGVSAGSLAYIIYTSGSTGRPKGVAIQHSHAVNFLRWARESFSTDVLKRTLFSTSLNFDLSVYECFVPLTVGAMVRLVRNALDCESDTNITLINTVPSAMTALLEGGKSPRTLRVVNVAGEPLKKVLVEKIFAATDVEVVWNLYGPTETTTYSTCAGMKRNEPFVAHIGKPIANTQVYVLDGELQPVPVSVTGEMYIGGAGVARGYLKRPALTAENFLPDPFATQPGARTYRTGDLARWTADGNIEFLGRNDGQVKIRGFRIELGEIEARLIECPGVEKAVVVSREDVPGQKSLLAYFTMAEGPSESQNDQDAGPLMVEKLRTHLTGILPEHMVPAAYVQLKALPMTANGKLDRKALPAPGEKAYVRRGYEAPQGKEETLLASIWAEVLGIQQVGRLDHFFQLGGHSLLAMRIVAHARGIFNAEIPVRLLFEKPVLHAYAEAVRELAPNQDQRLEGRLSRICRDGKLPLSFHQEGRLLVEWWAEMRSAPYAPFHLFQAFSLSPEADFAVLEEALNMLVSRHEILRTGFSDPKKMLPSKLPEEIRAFLARLKAGERVTGPEMTDFVNRLVFGESIFEQKIQAQVTLKLFQIDLDKFSAENQDAEMVRLGTEAIETRFDYENPPLIRTRLFTSGSGRRLLLLVMPHLLGDLWSLELFRAELLALYRACAGHTSSRLPEPAIHSVDFAAWQRSQLQGEWLEKLITYWKQRWSEFSLFDIKDLPFTKPVPETPAFIVETLSWTFDPLLCANVRPLLREKNITLHILWAAALNILLHLYAGKKQIGMWGLFANRIRPETENLMAWIANGHIIGVRLDPEQEIGDLLVQVKDVILEAHSYQELPSALLWSHFMKDLVSNPGAGRSPIQPHISFVTETRTDSESDSVIKTTEFPYRISGLALNLVVVDSGQDVCVTVQYSADRFSKDNVRRMMADWQQIIRMILVAPSTRVSELATEIQAHS
jgi:amino acid adenylation domain-containing protein